MSPKGRGSNKARSQAERGRGTQAGTLRRRDMSPIIRAGLLTDAELRAGVLDETATFYQRLRDKIRRRDR